MSCNKQVGIKNILLTFTNCNNGTVIGPIAHELSEEKLPDVRVSRSTSEPLPGGYTKLTHGYSEIKMSIIRDLRIPLSYYQDPGIASLDIQLEYVNGLVYTGTGGSVSGKDDSDTHGIPLAVIFDTLDELLPSGALATP